MTPKHYAKKIEFLADSDTQFLIYGRWNGEELKDAVKELVAELRQEHPGLLQREVDATRA